MSPFDFILGVLAAIAVVAALATIFRRDQPQPLNDTPWLRHHFDTQDAERRKREADAATRGGR